MTSNTDFKTVHAQYQAQFMQECSICLECFGLEDFKEQGKIFKTLCDHFFHQECFKEWSNKNPSCPQCRKYCHFGTNKSVWDATLQKIYKMTIELTNPNIIPQTQPRPSLNLEEEPISVLNESDELMAQRLQDKYNEEAYREFREIQNKNAVLESEDAIQQEWHNHQKRLKRRIEQERIDFELAVHLNQGGSLDNFPGYRSEKKVKISTEIIDLDPGKEASNLGSSISQNTDLIDKRKE